MRIIDLELICVLVLFPFSKTPAAQQRMKPAVGKVVNTLKNALEVESKELIPVRLIKTSLVRSYAVILFVYRVHCIYYPCAKLWGCSTGSSTRRWCLGPSSMSGGDHVEVSDSTTQYLCTQVRMLRGIPPLTMFNIQFISLMCSFIKGSWPLKKCRLRPCRRASACYRTLWSKSWILWDRKAGAGKRSEATGQLLYNSFPGS